MQVQRGDVTREMEIRGSAAELTSLADLLTSGHGSMDLDRVGDPAPYDRFLSRINVSRTSGPVVATCAAGSDELDIRGGSPQLTLFAANIEGLADEGDVTIHLHVDYFPGHDYLDESSEPLVVALEG